MSVTEFKEKRELHFEGINEWSGGEMYRLSAKDVDFEGARYALAIFDKNGILVAVLTKLNKDRFNSLLDMLQSKYTLIRKEIPFVGNKSAVFLMEMCK
jgi:hypothetical protein